MRILIVGKNGQLGRSVCELVRQKISDHNFVFVGRDELDLSQKQSILNYFYHNNFDVVVNCAAYTAVDKAESEMNLANQINHLAVRQMASIVSEQRAKFIHISTDYVFDGRDSRPYIEEDTVNPINVYGETKLAGERAVQMVMPTGAIIIRTSWLYSKYGHNFINTMLKLGREKDELRVVSDQVGAPTYALDLAAVVLMAIGRVSNANQEQKTSIFHYSNEGSCSWYEFAKKAFELKGIRCALLPITSNQYPTPAKRPTNTLMNKEKIKKEFNLNIPCWQESLTRYLLK